jgi:hypothetical protein
MLDELLGLHDVSGEELRALARDALVDVDRLVHEATSTIVPPAPSAQATAPSNSVDGAGGRGVTVGEEESQPSTLRLSAEEAASAVELQEAAALATCASTSHPQAETIQDLYDAAFRSLNKTLLLLHHWKTSWDAAGGDVKAMASAASGDNGEEGVLPNGGEEDDDDCGAAADNENDDPHLAEALASAAAVAAVSVAAAEAVGEGSGVAHSDSVMMATAAGSAMDSEGERGGENRSMASLLLVVDDVAVDSGGGKRHKADGGGEGGEPANYEALEDV